MSARRVRVLVVGLGMMAICHARAYKAIDEFELVGLCTRNAASARRPGGGISRRAALRDARRGASPRPAPTPSPSAPTPSITPRWPCRRSRRARMCSARAARRYARSGRADRRGAREARKTLLIGYILRVHPSWSRFVEIGRTLGKPLVMRMNLNQQSAGSFWQVHKNSMRSTSPIVDCGVHYVDIMCQVTRARPVAVHAVGARLTDEIAPTMYNYGCLDITFDDGSVGWYEAGWGPMISETAHFVKDIFGPNGSRLDRFARERRRDLEVRRPQHPHPNQRAARPSRGARRRRRLREARRHHLDRGRAEPSGSLRARAAVVPQGDPRRGRSDRAS